MSRTKLLEEIARNLGATIIEEEDTIRLDEVSDEAMRLADEGTEIMYDFMREYVDENGVYYSATPHVAQLCIAMYVATNKHVVHPNTLLLLSMLFGMLKTKKQSPLEQLMEALGAQH